MRSPSRRRSRSSPKWTAAASGSEALPAALLAGSDPAPPRTLGCLLAPSATREREAALELGPGELADVHDGPRLGFGEPGREGALVGLGVFELRLAIRLHREVADGDGADAE